MTNDQKQNSKKLPVDIQITIMYTKLQFVKT